MRIHTTHTRNAALQQLRRANMWLIALSVALTGVFADVAAHAFPGRTLKSTAAKPGAGGAAAAPAGKGATRTTPAQQLQPPAQTPQSAETPSSAESGRAQESAPAQESGPNESTPAHESTPAPEPAPEAHESAPATEASAPVISGGS